ncbi:MAG: acetyl-CoA carboxylase biotin carboxylase subunit [Bdellovibrionales bacterium]|nr:acetyl-CoA carboxylase biotin carboxylase subunit [Bdellovibrionales bacterium]
MKKHKLMVANRSEIACRVFQAAFEMGIPTLAIFVKGDEDARHLTLADEIAEVEGYLDVESILSVAKGRGVTLIHPGYGFLSERPHFAKAVIDAGIGFLGPLPETMEALGGKIAAKEIAEKLSIPTVPWAKLDMAKSSDAELKAAADRVGFPILIKAHAGGGGKGMRRVEAFSELKMQAESAAREALSSFGDGTLFFERYLQNPRHIEVQIFGDGKGRGVHLYERECSLQRRHQKVWEEAPAPNLPETVRSGLFESALKLVEYTKYRSAGTVEFLVEVLPDGSIKEFFFIEMNTRLQVEHPVTEAITGIDLVHEQIRLATGFDSYRLPDVVPPRGHAIEVRVCAEDPSQDFIPCTGTIDHLIFPSGPGIRVDRGIEVGQRLGTQFDSLCAKLIVHSSTRDLAVKKMQYVLRETVISGVGSNLGYLSAISHNPNVAQGRVSTLFLDQSFKDFHPNATMDAILLSEAFEKSEVFREPGTQGASGEPGSPSSWNSSTLWEQVKL